MSVCLSRYISQAVAFHACFFYSLCDILSMLLKDKLKFWNCKKPSENVKMWKCWKFSRSVKKRSLNQNAKAQANKCLNSSKDAALIHSLSVVFTNFIFSLYLFAALSPPFYTPHQEPPPSSPPSTRSFFVYMRKCYNIKIFWCSFLLLRIAVYTGTVLGAKRTCAIQYITSYIFMCI